MVVTGGSRGIGKGIASVFARSGARVLVTGRDELCANAGIFPGARLADMTEDDID